MQRAFPVRVHRSRAPSWGRVSPVWVLLGCLAACGAKSEDSSAAGTTGGATVDCGGPVDSVEPGILVQCDTGDCALEVVATDPAPPDRGDNIWTLRVVDAGGSALAVQSLDVAPFMPAHDHGTVPASYAGVLGPDDTWMVGPFDLFMPGRWELRSTVVHGDGTEASAIVAFCVEG